MYLLPTELDSLKQIWKPNLRWHLLSSPASQVFASLLAFNTSWQKTCVWSCWPLVTHRLCHIFIVLTLLGLSVPFSQWETHSSMEPSFLCPPSPATSSFTLGSVLSSVPSSGVHQSSALAFALLSCALLFDDRWGFLQQLGTLTSPHALKSLSPFLCLSTPVSHLNFFLGNISPLVH